MHKTQYLFIIYLSLDLSRFYPINSQNVLFACLPDLPLMSLRHRDETVVMIYVISSVRRTTYSGLPYLP